MKLHGKFEEIEILTRANISVLLTGEKGCGKTTIAHQIAEKLKLRFFSMSMTRQTTLSHLMGFMSVNGSYIPSLLKDAFENGGLFLLDEIDAGDPNVLLSLNTIENGYISFPTGIIDVHPDFRILATANPQNQHEFYTGRAKLDAATLDRFDIIEVDRDEHLEKSLVDPDTYRRMTLLREILKENNSATVVSMRDSMRYQKRKDLGLLNDFIYRLVDKSDLIHESYIQRMVDMPKHSDQSECSTFEELSDLVSLQSKNNSRDSAPQPQQTGNNDEQTTSG